MWIAAEPRLGVPEAEAGWKLHVSASTRTALPTLRIAVAVLQTESVAFKVAASVERLEELNQGRHGLSQVGKFVTVYAEDAAAARRIGFALARALRGQAGPRLRYERRVARDAPVWYRFGSFRAAFGLNAHGSLIPLLLGGAEPIADRREEVVVPPWAEADPFDGGDDADPAASVIGGRFVALRTMASSYKSDVFEAVDLHGDGKVTCILKRAHAETICDAVHDSIALLRREHDALERITSLRIAPTPFGFFEAGGDAFLAMTLEPGVTLDRYVAASRALGRRLDAPVIERFADTLVAIVAAAHRAGIAHRDLKGANLIVSDDGALRILDWDASAALDDPAFPRLATYGYTTGIDGPAASDVRGAASVVAALATGIDASRLPDPARLADALDRMREDLSASFRAAIRDALTQPQQFSSLAAWREAPGTLPRATQSTHAHHAVFPTDRELTRTVQWLVAAAHDTPDGVAWVSGDRERFGASLRDLYGGVAGIALVLDAAGTALGCGDALACAGSVRTARTRSGPACVARGVARR
jgi:serine/threonine protein kinase